MRVFVVCGGRVPCAIFHLCLRACVKPKYVTPLVVEPHRLVRARSASLATRKTTRALQLTHAQKNIIHSRPTRRDMHIFIHTQAQQKRTDQQHRQHSGAYIHYPHWRASYSFCGTTARPTKQHKTTQNNTNNTQGKQQTKRAYEQQSGSHTPLTASICQRYSPPP